MAEANCERKDCRLCLEEDTDCFMGKKNHRPVWFHITTILIIMALIVAFTAYLNTDYNSPPVEDEQGNKNFLDRGAKRAYMDFNANEKYCLAKPKDESEFCG